MRQRILRRTAALVAVATGLVSLLAPAASADPGSAPPPANCKLNADKSLAPGCFSLNVSPARVVVPAGAIPPGGLRQTFTVTNNGNTDYQLQVFAAEYIQDPDGGIAIGESVAQGEAAAWTSVAPSTVQMKGAYDKAGTKTAVGANSTAKVTVTIKPTANAAPGDHMVAIVFRKPADSGGNIKVAPQIGAQVIIQVPGAITSGVALSHASAKASHSLLGMNLPGSSVLGVDVTNKGNVHQDFFTVKDISASLSGFGAPKNALSFPQFTVLRDSTRHVSTSWSHQPLFCLCKITYTAHISRSAVLTSQPSAAQVAWKSIPGAKGYSVIRNGTDVADLPASAASWTDPKPLGTGAGIYSVIATMATSTTTQSYTIIPVWQILAVLVALIVLIVLLVVWRKRRKRNARNMAELHEQIRALKGDEAPAQP